MLVCACSVAFRWLLNDHEYVPHPELVSVRAAVVQVSSRVIGVMAGIRLADVTSVFVQKLEERVSARKDPAPRTDANLLRAQALKLCAGEWGRKGAGAPVSDAAVASRGVEIKLQLSCWKQAATRCVLVCVLWWGVQACTLCRSALRPMRSWSSRPTSSSWRTRSTTQQQSRRVR